MNNYVDPSEYIDDLPRLRDELETIEEKIRKNKVLSALSYPCLGLVFIFYIILASYSVKLFSDGLGMIAVLGVAFVVSISFTSQKKRYWFHRFLVEHLKKDIESLQKDASEIESFISFIETGKPVHKSFFMVSSH